jgi:LysM repeat protein
MRRRRSPGRWLAPLALLACAFAIYKVVDTTLLSHDDGKTKTTTTTQTAQQKAAAAKKAQRKKAKHRTYVVKPGDVLSAIAEKTGVSVDEIQRLNPSVDAATLRPGQKLRLTK